MSDDLATEAHLRALLECVPAAIAMFDRDRWMIAASHRWLAAPRLPSGWAELHDKALAVAHALEEPHGDACVRWEARPWAGADGRIGGVVVFADEVTERRRAEGVARASEGKLAAVVNSAVDGIVVIDAQGRIDAVNPAIERMFQRTAAELVGQNVRVLMPSPTREEHDGYLHAYLHAYLHGGPARVIGRGRDTLAQRADGTTFPIHLSVGEFRLGDRRKFTGIIRDQSAVERLQDELVQARSLAALGEAAAALSHELKNPLAAIQGVLEVVRGSLPEDDPRKAPLGGAVDQVRRLDGFVRQLLHLTRPWPVHRRPTDLAELPRTVAASAERDPRFERVRFVFRGSERLVRHVDPGMVHQVLWNLYLNAAQAMANGTVTVTVTEDHGAVRIAVQDDGSGMAGEIRDRLFELFFSTKTDGSGLGLSVCRKVMETHGGTITIDSAPGQGTTVGLRFPPE